jgi:hypothetical protein
VFEEQKQWDWSKTQMTQALKTGEVFTVQDPLEEPNTTTLGDEEEHSSNLEQQSLGVPDTPSTRRTRTPGSSSPRTPPATLAAPAPESISSVGPQGERDLKSIYDATSPVELECSGICLLREEEPANFEEAKEEQAWRKAMEDEMYSIQKNKTWKTCFMPRRT